jgi:hypothetical protein
MGFHIATSGRQTEKSQMQDAQKEKGQNAGKKCNTAEERTRTEFQENRKERAERTRVGRGGVSQPATKKKIAKMQPPRSGRGERRGVSPREAKKTKAKMQPPRIELGSPAWQARILPLDHGCGVGFLPGRKSD